MLTAEQEQQLVQCIVAGDKERFADVVREHQETVANLCYRLVGNKLDVEEVCQQVFVELYGALPRFRHQSRLSTFIYRITVNVVSKMLKHEKRFLPYETEMEGIYEGIEQTREDDMVKEEQRRRLLEAIGQLKYEQRTALVLFSFKELSYNDIADVMQVSLSKVESLIFRAKKNLQKIMTT
ncbi:MAG: RNA polymerase sigma factor [Bacteroidales bacterium]|nr:RNA polymerase sigma factor [Bacteroidales bacterium]